MMFRKEVEIDFWENTLALSNQVPNKLVTSKMRAAVRPTMELSDPISGQCP